ncbi:Uncharacterized protein dnm_092320 [Desulfonema magnum]|uniref:Uncharacterized protein n=1 Tax=Desulfonema magnum TaxID=45655 RepID=A0A975GTH8_9BACT|nr:Uncharacterized protein dnm_092320 [Desulfonema magnum]
MVKSDYKTENNNRKPGKSGITGKTLTKFRYDGFNNTDHNKNSFYN